MGMVKEIAVVTGGANGIGSATAARLAAKGYKVAVIDLDGIAVSRTVKGMHDLGQEAVGFVADVSDFQESGAIVNMLLDDLPISALVNCAGISQPAGILAITEEQWDKTIAVDLKGTFNWCRLLAPSMSKLNDARIVNVSSISAKTGGSKAAVSKHAYCAAKAGVLGLTRALAKELAPNVLVNAVCPGEIYTNLTAEKIDGHQGEIISQIPMARIGTPQDVAIVIEFLVTSRPCFVTGEIIDIDGGQCVN